MQIDPAHPCLVDPKAMTDLFRDLAPGQQPDLKHCVNLKPKPSLATHHTTTLGGTLDGLTRFGSSDSRLGGTFEELLRAQPRQQF